MPPSLSLYTCRQATLSLPDSVVFPNLTGPKRHALCNSSSLFHLLVMLTDSPEVSFETDSEKPYHAATVTMSVFFQPHNLL